jgi:hypothetical protein
METHVVDASGQRWKLMTLHFASVVAGVLMAYSLWRIDQLEAGRFALLMGAGVVIGLAALVWCCLSLRCPSCRTPWFWHAVSRQPKNAWHVWFSAMTSCPECGLPGPTQGPREHASASE